MMKFVFLSITIILVNLLQHYKVQSQLEWVPFDAQTAKGGHCYTDKYNIGAMERGEVRKKVENACKQATCNNGRDIEIEGCPCLGIDSSCTVKRGDPKKPFPECCIQVVCPKD